MTNGNLLAWKMIYALTLMLCLLAVCTAQRQQFERELKYLEYYMGIAPLNENGSLNVDEEAFDKYITKSSQLNCDLDSSSCLWKNAQTDGLLDTSNFYLFKKIDTKPFPIQVRPGNLNPVPGSPFLLAGNTTNDFQHAVLMSAPVLCQNFNGVLTFEYWLYNRARIEIVLLRINKAHGRLQVIARPPIDCHFLKTTSLCRVELKGMVEPFRIGIRAFSLGDLSIGSFAMINKIRYEAQICGIYERPKLFNGVPLTRSLRQNHPIESASDLNCGDELSARDESTGNNLEFLPEKSMTDCLWAAASSPTTAKLDQPTTDIVNVIHADHTQWSIGKSTQFWNEYIKTHNRPVGEFYFQVIDPMANVDFLPQLRSVLVPCTQSASSLQFQFWLSPRMQAQLCTLNTENVELSCVYLNEEDSPGPIAIDIESADTQPFRFAFRVIKFSNTTGGVIVLDNIKYSGYLCHETMPPPTNEELSQSSQEQEKFADTNGVIGKNYRQYGTSIGQRRPSEIEKLFNIKTLPASANFGNSVDIDQDGFVSFSDSTEARNLPFSDTLNCDFGTESCGHWLNNFDDNGISNDENITLNFAKQNNGGSIRKLDFLYGSVPEDNHLNIDSRFYGSVAIVAFSEDILRHHVHHFNHFKEIKSPINIEYALLTSQTISCAQHARLVVTYYSSDGTSLSICAGTHCVAQKRPFGELSVTITASQPFRIRILASTTLSRRSDYSARYRNALPSGRLRRPFRYRYFQNGLNLGAFSNEKFSSNAFTLPPFVIIKRIQTEGGFCRLQTPTELSCNALTCLFQDESLCEYESIKVDNDYSQFHSSRDGAVAYLSSQSGRRAILRSPWFRLSSAADLRFEASLSTFGLRLYICPNDEKFFQDSGVESQDTNDIHRILLPDSDLSTHCELILGPKIDHKGPEKIHIQLDESVRRFIFVAIHSAYEQFGDAHVILRHITLTTPNGDEPLC